MIYPMFPFTVTLSDPAPRFQGLGVIFRPIDALNVLCAHALTRDLEQSTNWINFCRTMLCISVACAVERCLSVRLFVRSSVCPWRSCILSKRINRSSKLLFSPSGTSHIVLAFCLSNAMHGQNINLPVWVCVCLCLSVTLSVNSPTGQTPQRIFTVDSFKRCGFTQGCAFWGLDDE